MWSLWRIERALTTANARQLAYYADFEAIRYQIRQRLNKNADSVIGDVSDVFIAWLSQGLQAYDQDHAVLARFVTIDWLYPLLQTYVQRDYQLSVVIDWTTIYAQRGLVLCLMPSDDHVPPLYVVLRPAPLRWRIIAVYY
jgi:hypothetical protein